MYLIDVHTFQLREFNDNELPKYAILSHTWGAEEVSFQDLSNPTPEMRDKLGYRKIEETCDRARLDLIKFAGVDTCCIDKKSSAELSEAINSMYRYYQQAEICFAYLEDVRDHVTDFYIACRTSRWFNRGWTLQELIAPTRLEFFNGIWKSFGERNAFAKDLHEITRIPESVLQGDSPLNYSIAQRMSWAADRKTTRVEDQGYCLMGLFDVNMPLLYGEGPKAFLRLQEEIMRLSPDQSILAWELDPSRDMNTNSLVGPLAKSASMFRNCSDVPVLLANQVGYAMTNVGLSISLPLAHVQDSIYVAILHDGGELLQTDKLVPLYLKKLDSNRYARTGIPDGLSSEGLAHAMKAAQEVSISILQRLNVSALQSAANMHGMLVKLKEPPYWVEKPIVIFSDDNETKFPPPRRQDMTHKERLDWLTPMTAKFDKSHGLSKTILAAIAIPLDIAWERVREHNGRSRSQVLLLEVGAGPSPTKDQLLIRWSMCREGLLEYHNYWRDHMRSNLGERIYIPLSRMHSDLQYPFHHPAPNMDAHGLHDSIFRIRAGELQSLPHNKQWIYLDHKFRAVATDWAQLRIRCAPEMLDDRLMLVMEVDCVIERTVEAM